jgi:hypothetical protein
LKMTSQKKSDLIQVLRDLKMTHPSLERLENDVSKKQTSSKSRETWKWHIKKTDLIQVSRDLIKRIHIDGCRCNDRPKVKTQVNSWYTLGSVSKTYNMDYWWYRRRDETWSYAQETKEPGCMSEWWALTIDGVCVCKTL